MKSQRAVGAGHYPVARTTRAPSADGPSSPSPPTTDTREHTDAMEPVTHGITWTRCPVRRHRDRRPVLGARGDRRAQRLSRARRRHRHQHVPHRLRRPRRAARGPSRATPDLGAGRRDGRCWPAPRCWAPAATPGVILSQMLRAYVTPPRRRRTPSEPRAQTIAAAMAAADRRELRRRRARPVEGTILTVARAASDAALATAAGRGRARPRRLHRRRGRGPRRPRPYAGAARRAGPGRRRRRRRPRPDASCSTRSRRRPPDAARCRAPPPIGTHHIPVAARPPSRATTSPRTARATR